MQYVSDDDGLVFDPATRAALEAFTGAPGDPVLPLLEAAAAVRSAAAAIEHLRSAGTGGRGLSAGGFDLLLRLRTSGDAGLPLGELAQLLGVTPRNVTGLVDTLEREGLVRRVPDPADRRSVRAVATAAGLAWLAEFRAPTRAAMTAVFARLSPAEAAQLRDLCLRLVQGVQGVRNR
ncbi:MarR family transcriptional regulator [Dactylosporangium aurantiacum]|uniref:MarR family transcriptional regulator n=1 Tax=Dactylosporangium aurantiacum TaxID=35754 RepID=A0A9Q9MK01_9ACTN|nr:MarR family transcriptional regulator [Dactylosporangium aurantiacum]MDG6107776.1 MarR family transcriptional regulator [Dactylosporangium aurantiacum]UWZ57445.1 MarR family transcriptional regulator [Dactylosporangium aurantiacum]